MDIEDLGQPKTLKPSKPVTNKRKRDGAFSQAISEDELNKSWREILGDPPPMGETKVYLIFLIRT